MSVCVFNSLPKSKYLNLFIIAAFSSKSFCGKTSSLLKNDDKAEILLICQSNCLSFVLLAFVIDCFYFLTNTHFYNKFFLNCSGLSYGKVAWFTKK